MPSINFQVNFETAYILTVTSSCFVVDVCSFQQNDRAKACLKSTYDYIRRADGS